MPKKNIGKTDRLLRLTVAIALLIFSYGLGSWILFALALFVFYEAMAGWCVIYQILGKNSCPR